MAVRRKARQKGIKVPPTLKAYLCFVRKDPRALDANRVFLIFSRIIDLHLDGGDRTFTRYRGFVEGGGRRRPLVAPQGEDVYRLPGRIDVITELEVRSAIAEKYEHEGAATRQQEGHNSVHAPSVLTPDTLVIMLGSPGFLGRLAEDILDRNQSRALLIKLNETLLALLYLKDVDAAPGLNHLECPVDTGKGFAGFYAGNFNRLIERIEAAREGEEGPFEGDRISDEEAEERIRRAELKTRIFY